MKMSYFKRNCAVTLSILIAAILLTGCFATDNTLLSEDEQISNVYVDLLTEKEEVSASLKMEESDAQAICNYFRGAEAVKDSGFVFGSGNYRLRIVSEEKELILYPYFGHFSVVRVGEEASYVFFEEESEGMYGIMEKYIERTENTATSPLQFNLDTNQNIVFHGVNLSIPIEWEENQSIKTENETCFEEFGASETEWKSLLGLVVYDDLVDSLEEGFQTMETMFADVEQYQILESDDLTIDGCAAKSITAKDMNEEGFYYKQTLLEKGDQYVLISLTCKDESTLQDYDQIIAHITVEP